MRPLLTTLLAGAALLSSCGGGFADPTWEFGEPLPDGPDHAITIHEPAGLGVLDTDRTDIHGAPIGIACGTCHGPDGLVDDQDNPEDMHGDLVLRHGDGTCDSCHAADRTRLKLADGRLLEMDQAMDLCAQCHGPQKRDYDHGSHGGMTGYWDLQAGPRSRNHCLDCHGAHDPAYRGGLAVHPPRDRFLYRGEEHGHE